MSQPTPRPPTRAQPRPTPTGRSPTDRAPATFDATNTNRLRNLIDDTNAVVATVTLGQHPDA